MLEKSGENTGCDEPRKGDCDDQARIHESHPQAELSPTILARKKIANPGKEGRLSDTQQTPNSDELIEVLDARNS